MYSTTHVIVHPIDSEFNSDLKKSAFLSVIALHHCQVCDFRSRPKLYIPSTYTFTIKTQNKSGTVKM